jgi:formylglycine-generating enzyme required for sulfatase activity
MVVSRCLGLQFDTLISLPVISPIIPDRVEAGSLVIMGSPVTEAGRLDDEQMHQVIITKGFYLGKHEVTQAQWRRLMWSNPSYFKAKGGNLPVEGVTWGDCMAFCKKAGGFRLPTEAEWEYACRAGTTAIYGGTGKLEAMGWYSKNSGKSTHPVGEKQPNAWGLFDMHGNVWEWCSDWYGLYPKGKVTDPTGPASGYGRAIRGGDWLYFENNCRSASRGENMPGSRSNIVGFRVAMSLLGECASAKSGDETNKKQPRGK